MKSHTSEFKEEIKTLGKQQSVRITYTLNNEQIILTDEDINSATPNYEASLLKSVMKGLDLDSNTDIPLGTEIKFEYGLLVNGAYEYLNYGNYIVYSSEKQEDTLSYKIKCYDKMLYSMKDYEHIEITYPCTIKEYLIALCNKIGLEFKDSTFANQDREIQNELFMTTNEDGAYSSMGYTYRDVLDQIAETTGGCICLTLDDKVEVRYVNKTINYEQSEKSNIIQFKTEVEEPIILERLEGKSIQATRSGKNFFDASKISNRNIIVSDNGKTIKMPIVTSGNGYTQVGTNLKGVCPKLEVGDTVYLLGDTTSQKNKIIYLGGNSKFPWEFGKSRTITENDLNASFVLYGNNFEKGETEQVTISNLRIVKNASDEWEEYGASPSPDYPSEIENIEGKNKLDYKTVSNTSNTVVSLIENGFNVNGMYAGKVIVDNLKKNTNYYLQYLTENIAGALKQVSIFAGDTQTNALKTFNNSIGGIFNTGENTKINIWFYANNKPTTTGEANFTNIQLEEGTVATPYVPYNSLEIKVEGKNKFDINTAQLNKALSWASGNYFNDTGSVASDFIKVENNKTYISKYYIQVILFDENKNYIKQYNGINFQVKSFTINENNPAKYVKISFYSMVNNDIDFTQVNDLMLEEGSTATDYEPYKSQVVTFPLGEEKLMEGSYLADDGIHHKRKQVVLDGSDDENWTANGTNQGYAIVIDNVGGNTVGNVTSSVLCDKLTAVPQNTIYNGSAINGVASYGGTVSKLYVRFDSSITTGELLREKLAANPITVEYELATEEIIPYTEAQKTILTSIKTMKGTNIFEFPSDTIISYPINYDTIDEEYINNTNVSFGEKYGAINSIVLARAGESDKIYKKDQASIDENGLCELMISENQFMNFNDRSDYLQELSDKLFGVEYYLNDFTSTGIMYYDLLDVYNVKIGDKTYNCLMLNDEQDITQGLEENIHTERPEKSETDYTKADKTDQKINQTNLVVDKQNQKIEGVISQIGDRSEKTTTITADIDGLNSKVSQIEDVTNETTSTTGILILENCQKGPLLNLKIFGNNTVFKYLYPSDTLYPSNTLYPYGDSRIVVTSFPNGSETGISKIYELGVMDVLRQSGNIRDEFIIEQSQAKVIRRINKDGSIKDNEEIEELGKISIDLKQGKNTIQIQNYTAEMYCKYAIQSEYTDIFATKVEMNSSITQASDEINLEVRKKVDENEVISKINQSAEQIQIEADKISLKRKNIKFSR